MRRNRLLPSAVLVGAALTGGVFAPAALAQRPPQIKLSPGFKIEKVAGGLTYPSSLTFGDQGRMYVAEAGGAFLEKPPPARILEIANGRKRVAVNLEETGVKDSVVGLAFHRGSFFISHRAQDRTGAVSRVSLDGTRTEILSGILDSQAEHQVNDVKVGPDGRIYLAAGPATNSGVVGIDNAPNVARSPLVHTTTCRDLVLTGMNFLTANFRTKQNVSDTVLTGAYQPFGVATRPGQVVQGRNKCGGSILAFDPDNAEATVRPFADGLRNVIGIAFDRRGDMFAAVNGFDVRGSRPVDDDFDPTYRIRRGTWYGWPDFSAALEPVTRRKFDVPDALQVPVFRGRKKLKGPQRLTPLIDLKASGLRRPDKALIAGLHPINSSPSMLAVAPASWGRFAGQLFAAEWGDLAPPTNPLRNGPVGSRVSRVTPGSGGKAMAFARNPRRGPASAQGLKGRALERPFDIEFGPDNAMYIVDYGIARINPARLRLGEFPYEFPPRTGVIWKVTPTKKTTSRQPPRFPG